MTDLSRLLDERLDERIISAINDLDFQQFQQLITNLLKSIGVIVVSKEELGDSVLFRGEGEGGAYLIMASRLFDHSSIMNARRVKAMAASENRNAVIMLTNDMDPDAKAYADKEEVSYADKKRLLLLLRKYQLADALMQEIDKRVLAADGERVLPSAGKFDQHMLSAIEHMEKGRFKDAIYSLDRALEIKPTNDQIWQSRANALFNLGRFEEALESCRKATDLRPTDVSSWYLMGLILGQMGDYDGEVKAYDIILKLQPGNRSAILNKGTALYKLGKLDKALKVFDQLLKEYPMDVMAQNNRGIVLKSMGRTPEALESFRKASTLDRNYINPIINTGLIHSESGQHDLAIEDWERALQLERRRPDILLSLAASFKEVGDLESALQAVRTALEIDPDLEEAKAQRDELEAILSPPPAEAPAIEEAAEEEPVVSITEEERNEPEQVAVEVREEGEQHPAVIESGNLPMEAEKPGAVVNVAEGALPATVEAPGPITNMTAGAVPAKIEEPGAIAEIRHDVSVVPIEKEEVAVANVEVPGPVANVAEGPNKPAIVEKGPVANVAEAAVPAKIEAPGPIANVIEGALPATVGSPGPIVSVVEGPAPAKVEPSPVATVAEAAVPAKIEEPGAIAELRHDVSVAPIANEETSVAKIEEPGPIVKTEVPGPVVEVPTAEVPQVAEPIDPLRERELTVKFLMLVGDLPQALIEADRALEAHPGELSLMRSKASVLASSGRHDAALTMMSEIYSKERDEGILYDIESISYLFGQRKEGAQILSKMTPSKESVARELSFLLDTEQFDAVIVKASRSNVGSSGLTMAAQALALMRKGRYRDAAKIWKDMLGQFPANAECLNNLGVCMRFMGEYGYEEPIHFMLLATLIDPMYADAYSNIGCAYFAAGAYDQALINFEKAISIDRKPEYYLNMSSVQLAGGDVEGAKASLTSALKLEETAEVLFMLGVIAEREGDIKWAAHLYEDAIAAKPDFRDAVFNLQRVKLQLKFRG